MPGGKVIIHYDDRQELFDVDDFNNVTVESLLKRAQLRFYEGLEELLADPDDCLCEGPYLTKGIDDVRLRAIVQMLQEPMAQNHINQEPDIIQKPVQLWFYDYLNNKFLSEKFTTTGEQRYSGDTGSVDGNDRFGDTPFPPIDSESSVTPQPGADVEPIQNISSQDEGLTELLEAPDAYLESLIKTLESSDTSSESSNEDVPKFTKTFRNEQKIQYRTDVFPLNKNKKANKSISTNTKAASNTANKKRKTYKKGKKYAFYLQAVQSTEQCRDSKYPCIQLTRHQRDLMQKGKKVSVYIAVTKYINGRRYVDALKGFLINKDDRKIPLENPCLITFEWANEKKPPPKDYPLKLALIQVSGDKGRKSKVEFNEMFNFAQRTVDESSKFSDYNTADNTDEPDGFLITAVPAKDDAPLEADWPLLTESGTIHYKIGKSNKKQKTNSPVPSSLDQGRHQTTQDSEEEEEEEDNDDDEDYDDEE